MPSNGMFYLPIYAFAYKLQVEMYLFRPAGVAKSKYCPATGVDRMIIPWLLNQHFFTTYELLL